ncbi:hypothetical protein JX265_013638 [Neoarthrinium moseri]|uniref:S-adenosyl-L-methionine-dependent methyltransferase n=1 Tax=Neoarthrinium moseri TaxID=1658444 RepID=A0A9P9W8A3_9PEZI|nr:hypothetical protein JX265_013638 [Neoarthrinium moseri]
MPDTPETGPGLPPNRATESQRQDPQLSGPFRSQLTDRTYLYTDNLQIEATSTSATAPCSDLEGHPYQSISHYEQQGSSVQDSSQESLLSGAVGFQYGLRDPFQFVPELHELPTSLGLPQFHNAHNFVTDFLVPGTDDEVANRVSSGSSVAEPGSILGESGRTYHGYEPGKYFLPNDAAEQDRLDFQHAALVQLFGDRLFRAPLDPNLKYTLDVATGTGIWALEFAQRFPNAQVIGTDLSLIQPLNLAAPNCQFYRQDAEKDWDFGGILFDYIHLRFTFSCFDNPRGVAQSVFDSLNPGGWVEYQESIFDLGVMGGTAEGTAYKEYCDRCNAGARILRGRDMRTAPCLKGWLEELGYEGVVEEKYLLPANPWPKERKIRRVGLWWLRNALDGLRGIGWKMLQATGLTASEIETLVNNAKAEVRDTSNRFYFTVYVVYGRKPLGHYQRF